MLLLRDDDDDDDGVHHHNAARFSESLVLIYLHARRHIPEESSVHL
jgi:hypothetical protein